MPKLMGSARPVGWLTVEDLAVIAAKAFGDPDRFIGREVMLTSDAQSIDACRDIWREVTGRSPRRFPVPRRLFERSAGTDETTMWQWLGANEVDFDTGPTLAIHPEALTVREWLERKQARSVRRRQAEHRPGADMPDTSARNAFGDCCPRAIHGGGLDQSVAVGAASSLSRRGQPPRGLRPAGCSACGNGATLMRRVRAASGLVAWSIWQRDEEDAVMDAHAQAQWELGHLAGEAAAHAAAAALVAGLETPSLRGLRRTDARRVAGPSGCGRWRASSCASTTGGAGSPTAGRGRP